MFPTAQHTGSAKHAAPSLPAFAGLVAVVSAYLVAVPLAARKDGDFVHLWAGGRLVRSGLYDVDAQRRVLTDALGPLTGEHWMSRNDLVGVFLYPPPAAALYAPLGLFGHQAAAGVMAVVNVALAVACAAMLARVGALRFPAATMLLLLFPSTFFAYVLGQNGLLTLAVLLGGALLLLRHRDLAAGVVLGLLIYKPSWLVAAGWLPLVLGRWKALPGVALGALVASALGAIVAGPAAWTDWLALAPQVAGLDTLPDYPLDLQHDLLSLPRRWLGIGPAATVVGWAASAGLVGATLWRSRTRPPLVAVGMGLAAAVLVNPHVHHYDMLPSAAALAIALSGWGGLSATGRAALAALVVVHHGAFVLGEVADIGGIISMPALATLAVWAWLGWAPRGDQA